MCQHRVASPFISSSHSDNYIPANVKICLLYTSIDEVVSIITTLCMCVNNLFLVIFQTRTLHTAPPQTALNKVYEKRESATASAAAAAAAKAANLLLRLSRKENRVHMQNDEEEERCTHEIHKGSGRFLSLPLFLSSFSLKSSCFKILTARILCPF